MDKDYKKELIKLVEKTEVNKGYHDYFKNKDLVSVKELVSKLEDYYAEIEKQQEEIEDLKEYKNQYCELYDQYCR